MNDCERFEQLIEGGDCCISIMTTEERYALEIVRKVAEKLKRDMWVWSVADGVRDGLIDGSPAIANTDSPAADVGTLTGTRLTGLGMADDHVVAGRTLPGGITYAGFEDLTVLLGYGAGTFTIESTHSGTTTIDLGPGNDVVTVRTLSGHTRALGSSGDDRFVVGTTSGTLDALAALLVVDGGAGVDTATFIDAGDTGDNLGWLDQTTLRGLDMIARTGLDALGRPLDQLYSVVPRAGATSFTIVLSQVVGGVATGIGAATFAVGATPEQIRAALQLLLFGQTAGADAGVSMTCGEATPSATERTGSSAGVPCGMPARTAASTTRS